MHHYSRINQKQRELENALTEDIDSINLPSFDNGFSSNTSLKIERIDKNYQKYNAILVAKAIGQGALVLFLAYVVFNPTSHIGSSFKEVFNGIFDSIMQTGNFTQDQAATASYASLFEGAKQIIDKMGLLGIALAIQSVNFIRTTVSNAKRSLTMKLEIEELKEQVQRKKM